MRGGPLDLTRLAIEAAFLLLVAVGAGFAGLAAGWIVLVVAGAWALVALFEWQLHRRREVPASMADGWLEKVRSLLEAPSPAVLTTYRQDGSALVVFEAVRPFRGIEVRGRPELVEGDVTDARTAIAGRYLGASDGRRFAEERRSKPGVLLRLVPEQPRVWDLSGILPP